VRQLREISAVPPQALTWDEEQMVERIAAWKAEPPSYLSALLDKLTGPLVKLTKNALPPEAVAQAIRDAYASSEAFAHRETVAREAGVNDVREIRQRDLEYCRRLAADVALDASRHAMFWGAASGGGNALAALVSVTALVAYSLKTIHSIGYCFGYGTDEPHERDFVLGVLLIASASTLKEKDDALATLEQIEERILEEAYGALLEDAIGERILESAGLASLPLVAILTGAMESAAVVEHISGVAHYCFAERWLRDRRGIDRIAPDPGGARSLPRRVRTRVASGLYWAGYAPSFILGVPLALLFRWVPTDHAIGHGLADGGRDGGARADRLAAKIKGTGSVPRSLMLIEAAAV
jgi:hypothetical protein